MCTLSLIWMVGFTTLIVGLTSGGTYHSCENREYIFMIFREYTIISRNWKLFTKNTIDKSKS